MTFALIPLAEAQTRLRGLDADVLWLGRSGFLWAGCEDAVPNSRVSVIGSAPDPPARIAGRRRVAIGFEADAATSDWAARCGADLLMPPHPITEAVGDKTALPDILRAADVTGIESITYRENEHVDPHAVRQTLGYAPLVVQRAENNLTGTGTVLVRDDAELARALAAWRGRRLKVTQYMTGTSLTISGCVGRTATIVSAISRQLVGVPQLTAVWAAHCGNALVDPADLAADTLARCTDACARVGDELRHRGFYGAFGLDLLHLPNGSVVVVEINPRVQSVTSLISIAEVESGILPVPAAHVLSLLDDAAGATVTTWPGRIAPLQQLVLYARRSGRLLRCPNAGAYALRCDEAIRVDDTLNLRRLDDGQVLLWQFAVPGNIEESTRLCVVQGRLPLIAARNMTLSPLGAAWVDAVDRLFHIEP